MEHQEEMQNGSAISIETKNISKSFGLVRAVSDVSVSVSAGEARGLVGENGAGKSTLLKVLSGITQPDHGTILKSGKLFAPRNMVEAHASGLSIILQEVGIIPSLSVAANLYLGRTNHFVRGGIILKKRMYEQVRQLLSDFGASHIDPRMPIGRLSKEDQKYIEVIRSLAFTPDVLLVDETSAALPGDGCDLLFEKITEMKAAGASILFVSHRLREVLRICDSVTVLRDGELVETLSSADLDEEGLRSLMVGREFSGHYYRSDQIATRSDRLALTVRNLTINGSFHGISLEIHAGEIVGIGGLTGCGMHPLGKALFGLLKVDDGVVQVESGGSVRTICSAKCAASNGIGYVPRDRNEDGLMLTSSIRDNICLPTQKQLQRQGRGIIRKRAEKELAQKGVELLDIKATSIEQLVIALSGGNRQKVALAKWLAREDLKVLILDCPARGIDVGVKAYIYELLTRLKEQNIAILLISEELPELIGMADRILIMKEGRLNKEYTRAETLKEEILIKSMI